jgi:Glyoxalase-like domain
MWLIPARDCPASAGTRRLGLAQTVARSLGLGARHIDIGQRPEESHVVLADPDGHEFCVLTP